MLVICLRQPVDGRCDLIRIHILRLTCELQGRAHIKHDILSRTNLPVIFHIPIIESDLPDIISTSFCGRSGKDNADYKHLHHMADLYALIITSALVILHLHRQTGHGKGKGV